MLVQYIRKRNGQKKGVLVSLKQSDTDVVIGWSLCNTRVDNFDQNLGLHIACERSEKGVRKEVPDSIKGQVENFKKRCARYYKGANIEVA